MKMYERLRLRNHKNFINYNITDGQNAMFTISQQHS